MSRVPRKVRAAAAAAERLIEEGLQEPTPVEAEEPAPEPNYANLTNLVVPAVKVHEEEFVYTIVAQALSASCCSARLQRSLLCQTLRPGWMMFWHGLDNILVIWIILAERKL